MAAANPLVLANAAKRVFLGCLGNTTSLNMSNPEQVNNLYGIQAGLCLTQIQDSLKIPHFFRQGSIIKTDIYSYLAIKGIGFFMVNDTGNSSLTLLTRDGSFSTDSNGHLTNAGGYQLQGYDINQNFGNIDLYHISPLSYNLATSNIKIAANLNAAQATIGTAITIQFPFGATNNYGIGALSVIANETIGSFILKTGDYINITTSITNVVHQFTYRGYYFSNNITTTILNANTIDALFTGATDGWEFQITSQDYLPAYFSYSSISPNITLGQFNTLNTLSQAIDLLPGFNARIVGPFLYLAPVDASQNWNITDVNGIFTAALFNGTGTTASVVINAKSNSFASLSGLAKLINTYSDIGANIFNPSANTALEIYATNPSAVMTIAASTTNLLQEFGLTSISPYSYGPEYDMTGTTAPNMASGKVTAQFSMTSYVLDSLAVNHTIIFSFYKLSANTWSSEIYMAKMSDITTSRSDSQIAAGYVIFNGDGSLNSLSISLTQALTITWSNGAVNSAINVNFGTYGNIGIGKLNGICQLSGNYTSYFAEQDGLPMAGRLETSNIDVNGNINATYANGGSINLYSIPLAYVANPSGLTSYDVGVFIYNSAVAGTLNISNANNGFMGQIESYSLEILTP